MKTSFLLLGATLLVAACSSDADQARAQDDPLTITPGTGSALVTFTVPDGSPPATVNVQRGSDWAVTRIPTGTPTSLPVGSYCVWASVPGLPSHEESKICGNTFSGTMTFAFGGVRFFRSRNEAVLGIDLSLGDDPDVRSDDRVAALLRKTGVVIPLAAGEHGYTYMFGRGSTVFADYSFSVVAGEVTALDLNDVTGHESLRLDPPPWRETSGAWGKPGVTLKLSVDPERPYIYSNLSFSSIGDRPVLLRKIGYAKVTLILGPYTLASLETAPDTSPRPVLQLYRADVARAVVPLADGTSVTVPNGSCFIRPRNVPFVAEGSPDTFALPGGLDLPAGDYNANVTYRHPATHTPVTDVHAFTLL